MQLKEIMCTIYQIHYTSVITYQLSLQLFLNTNIKTWVCFTYFVTYWAFWWFVWRLFQGCVVRSYKANFQNNNNCQRKRLALRFATQGMHAYGVPRDVYLLQFLQLALFSPMCVWKFWCADNRNNSQMKITHTLLKINPSNI